MNDRRDDYYQPWLRDKDGNLRPMAPPDGGGEGIAKPRESAPLGLDISAYVPPLDDADPAPRAARSRAMPDAGAAARTGAAAATSAVRTASVAAKSTAGRFAEWTIRLADRVDVPARLAALDLGNKVRRAGAGVGQTMKAGANAGAAIGGKAAAATSQTARKGWQAAAVGDKIAAAGKAVRAQGEALGRSTQDALAQAADAGKKATNATGAALKAQIRPDTPPPPESGLDRLIAQETSGGEAAAAPARPVRPAPSLPLFAEQDVPPATKLPPLLAGSPLPPQVQQPSAKPTPMPAPKSPPAKPPIDWPAVRARLRALPDERPWALIAAASLLVGIGGYWAGSQFGSAGSLDAAADDIGPAVRAYIMANPEIIREAIQADQDNRTAAAVNAVRDDVEVAYAGAWAGNADGDVTMVVFTDYACVFCRKSLPDIERLLRDDRSLKIVYREIPILSAASADAARAALAAAKQGKYRAFHNALFAVGTLDKASIAAVAARTGVRLDTATLGDKAIEAELQKNLSLAQQLGFEGTPTWIIGKQQLSGAVGYDQLKQAVDAARRGGNG